MQRRTAEIQARIQDLQKPESFRHGLLHSPKEQVRLLQEIGDSGEISAIPDIIAFALNEDTKIAVAAVEAVHHLLSQALPEDLAWLDEQMRSRLVVSGYGVWSSLKPARLEALHGLRDATASLLGLASFHRDGYVREKAIALLAKIHDGHEMPYLLLRANDWVEQVRYAAQEAIRARLIPDYASYFANNLVLVERLQRSTRDDHAELVCQIFQLLQRPEARSVLCAGFTSSNRHVRRTSYRLALTAPDENVSHVLSQALREPDPIIRTMAVQQAAAVLEPGAQRNMLLIMLHDPFMQVRRSALQITVEQFPDMARGALLTALLDPNATIREFARYYLRRIEPMDFAVFYRDALGIHNGNQLLGAIHGIGETGIADDAERLLPYTAHGTIRVRKAAVREIAYLHGDAYLSLFMKVLIDARPGLSNTGRDALLNRMSITDTVRLAKILHTSPHEHVRKNVLLLLARLGKWVSLPFLIRAACDEDERTVSLARRLLGDWLRSSNRYFVAPTAEQLARIRKAFEECRSGLDEEERRQILFALNS